MCREVGEEARQGERLICDAGLTKPQPHQWGALEQVCPNVQTFIPFPTQSPGVDHPGKGTAMGKRAPCGSDTEGTTSAS